MPFCQAIADVSFPKTSLHKHARYYWLLLAEGHLHRRLFGQMLRANLGAADAERVAPRLQLQILGLRKVVGAVSEKIIAQQPAGFVRQRKPADETPPNSLGPTLMADSLLSRAGQAYDARGGSPNRKPWIKAEQAPPAAPAN